MMVTNAAALRLAICATFGLVFPAIVAQYAAHEAQIPTEEISLIQKFHQVRRSKLTLNLSALTEIRQTTISKEKHLQPDYPEYTHVNVSIWPMALARLDEPKQSITIKVDVRLKWFDRRLRWPTSMLRKFNISNEALHREKDKWWLPFSEASVWTPRILNLEAPSELEFARVIGHYDGWMRMRGMFVKERTCHIQAKYFPFDRQCCPLTIATHSMAILHAELIEKEGRLEKDWQRVKAEKKRGGVAINYETGEWIMYERREYLRHALNTNLSSEQFQSDLQMIQYKLLLTRRPFQHVLSWIVPPILLSTSTVIAVFKGCDASERLSFAASVLVTMGVILDSLREHLPVSMDGYPVLGQMYLGLMLSLVLTILVCNSPERLYPSQYRPSALKPPILLDKLALIVAQKYSSERAGGSPNGLPGIFWPATRATFRNNLMYGILTLQALIVLAVTAEWMMHPLGLFRTWFGTAMSPEDFCAE